MPAAAPRLYLIYAKEVLQFLPRKKVERLKLVSSAMDEAVMGCLNRLPKRKFMSLWVTKVSVDRCQTLALLISLLQYTAFQNTVLGGVKQVVLGLSAWTASTRAAS